MFNDDNRQDAPKARETAWSPLLVPIFRALWIANIVSNIGTWMQNTATAWLMTSLAPSAVMVSLVQTATSLPIFLLALPAGALADVMDRRRLILFTQTWMLLAAAILGVLTLLGYVTPWLLLVFTLMIGLGSALNAPAWQSVVPELVPRPEIPSAVALNSAGFNLARSVGPALGGLLVGVAGAGPAFLFNAASYLAVIVVLLRWKRSQAASTLPAEDMVGAMRAGIRYVRYSPALRNVFIRAAVFVLCASSQMALLPLYARDVLKLGSLGYGILLGGFGIGAVGAAALLPTIRSRLQLDALSRVMTLVFAASLIIMAFVHNFAVILVMLTLGGGAWLSLLASFNSSVQAVVPSWVRGRAMAVYMLIFFGGMALGSFLWGAVATVQTIPITLLISAFGLIAGLAVTLRYRLAASEDLDLTPSMHWASPEMAIDHGMKDGPVLVTVEYRIDPARSREFGLVMRRLRNARLSGGAMRWDLYEDGAVPGRYVESFLSGSWIDHMRQHERVTVADQEVEKEVRVFHIGPEWPVVTHYLARRLPED